MSYILDGSTIRSPQQMHELNETQQAQHRTLDGGIHRDHFGDNKRVWELTYRNTKKTDYDTIKAIYTNYLTDSAAKSWEVTEANYTISLTNVHVDLKERAFFVRGTDYLSDFDLVLTEA